jgi:hypothetical protein
MVEAYPGKLGRSRILPRDAYNKFNVVYYSHGNATLFAFGREV